MNSRLYNFFHPELTQGNIFKTVLAFSLPIIVSYLFQQLYNAVDTVIIGNYLKEDSLAAVGSTAAIFELLVGFGTGFGNGLGIVAARSYGAGLPDRLKKIVFASIVSTAGVTVLIMLFGHFFLKDLLVLLGTPASILEEAFSYIWYIAIFSGVLFAYNLLSGLLRAIGNSFMPLVFLIISSILNIGLDILLITQFKMGVKGTAIATVISQGISAILCLIYILVKTRILIPGKIHLKAEPVIYKELISQGLSMALMSALVSSGSIILQSSINGFDKLIIAGHISARKIFGLTMIPLIAMGVSSATFVSQNLGAGKTDRIRKGVMISSLLCIIWSVICIIVIPLTARTLISLVSGSKIETVVEFGADYISFMQPFYLVLGVLFVLRNSLQGLGCKIPPLFSSIIELAGKILFTLFIIPMIGKWGIIMCEPLIWCAMTLQLIIAFVTHPAIRKSKKCEVENKNQ